MLSSTECGHPIRYSAQRRACWLLSMFALLISLVVTGAPVLADMADPGPVVTIEATDPSIGEVLQRGEVLYLRLRYRSDIPLRFQIVGFFDGVKQQGAQSNTSPVYDAGQGEALVWLAFRQATYLDRLRVAIMTSHWKEIDSIELPVSIAWDGAAATSERARAAWVRVLDDEQQALTQRALEQSAVDPGDDWTGLLIMAMGWSIPGYIVLQILALRRYRAGWRKAAIVPFFVTIPAMLHALIALLSGSNLWPLVMLFILPLGFVYLVALAALKWLKKRAGK